MSPKRPWSLIIAALALLVVGALGVGMAWTAQLHFSANGESTEERWLAMAEIALFVLTGVVGFAGVVVGLGVAGGREWARKAGMYLAFWPVLWMGMAASITWASFFPGMMAERARSMQGADAQVYREDLSRYKRALMMMVVERTGERLLLCLVVAGVTAALLKRPAVKAYCRPVDV